MRPRQHCMCKVAQHCSKQTGPAGSNFHACMLKSNTIAKHKVTASCACAARIALHTDIQVLQQEMKPMTDDKAHLNWLSYASIQHQLVHTKKWRLVFFTLAPCQDSLTLRSSMQLNKYGCCTCHSTLAGEQVLNQALHTALIHKNATQDDTKQPAPWNCLLCIKSAVQQLRVAAACCSWACALFSFALQQDRSTVQSAVFNVTYLLD